MAESVEAPDVRSLQTLTAASASWGAALGLAFAGLAMVATAIHYFANGFPPHNVTTGVFALLTALPLLGMAFFAVRLGFGLRNGTQHGDAILLSLAWAVLLAVTAVRIIWYSTTSPSETIASWRTPGVLLLICAAAVGLTTLLWSKGAAMRTFAGLAACGSVVLFLVVGGLKTGLIQNPGLLPSHLASVNLLVPVDWLAGTAALLVALALLLRSWSAARAFGSFLNAVGILLFGIAAVVAMTSVLQANPFGGRFAENQVWADMGSIFWGSTAITFGIAGIAALLWVLLALVSNGPALASSARKAVAATPARSCGKCGTGLAVSARFCNSCGAKAA